MSQEVFSQGRMPMSRSHSIRKSKKSEIQMIHSTNSPPQRTSDDKDSTIPLQVTAAATGRRNRRRDKKLPLIPFGTLIMGKFELMEVIGAGGYGQIYKAETRKKTYVAVKIMTRRHEPQRMILEQQILYHLRGKPSFPLLYASGTFESYMFIVMELLGNSLSELRKREDRKRFDAQTAIRVGIQVTKSLKIFHDMGYVHRDIKPGNLCVGSKPETIRSIYLVDFGLARKFKENSKIKKREQVGFRGTLRYASINVHEKKDQCACDDLISLFYTIVELSEGLLPWAKTRQGDNICKKKRAAKFEDICTTQPVILMDYYTYCYETVEDPHEPNYAHLEKILQKCLPPKWDANTPMTWELQNSEDSVYLRNQSSEIQ